MIKVFTNFMEETINALRQRITGGTCYFKCEECLYGKSHLSHILREEKELIVQSEKCILGRTAWALTLKGNEFDAFEELNPL